MFALTILAVSLASSLPGSSFVNAVAIPVRRSARHVPMPLLQRNSGGQKVLKMKKRSSPDGIPGHIDITSMSNGVETKKGYLLANTTQEPYTLDASPTEFTQLWLFPSDENHASIHLPLNNSTLCACYDPHPVAPEPLTLRDCDLCSSDGSTVFAWNRTSGVVAPIFQQNDTAPAPPPLDRRQTQEPPMSVTLKFRPDTAETKAAQAATVPSSSLDATTTTTTVTVYTSLSSPSPSPMLAQAEEPTTTITTTVTLSASQSTPSASALATEELAVASTTSDGISTASSSTAPSLAFLAAAPAATSSFPSILGSSSSLVSSASSSASSSSSTQSSDPSIATPGVQPEQAEAVLVGGVAPRARGSEAYAPWW
ncbi:hypothetical protein MIND_00620200 [Mycena indigotica]|uniref:Uncharacterized protein n=1 Tax=Mycena indigotica TaxID=2126181 RepID=A0A8H6SRW1_9AGAR|nr:uncharacterized protein MIND_00620200 [Mycena indigotica]KAF7303900.1 hypothetical protein MIND_00620200 [Mycena indigotica]